METATNYTTTDPITVTGEANANRAEENSRIPATDKERLNRTLRENTKIKGRTRTRTRRGRRDKVA